MQTECWLSPNGKIYAVTFGRHDMMAAQICEEQGWTTRNPGLELEKRGFLHVGTSTIGPKNSMEITDAQYNVLFAMYKENNSTRLGREIERYLRSVAV